MLQFHNSLTGAAFPSRTTTFGLLKLLGIQLYVICSTCVNNVYVYGLNTTILLSQSRSAMNWVWSHFNLANIPKLEAMKSTKVQTLGNTVLWHAQQNGGVVIAREYTWVVTTVCAATIRVTIVGHSNFGLRSLGQRKVVTGSCRIDRQLCVLGRLCTSRPLGGGDWYTLSAHVSKRILFVCFQLVHN